MPWWLIVFDVYVVCFAIMAWALSTAPVIIEIPTYEQVRR
jgi:hypothetical protein